MHQETVDIELIFWTGLEKMQISRQLEIYGKISTKNSNLECRFSISGSIYLMNLPSGDLIEIVGHNFRRLLGVFVSGVVGGLRYHMTRSGHVIGAMSMLLGVLGPCRGLRMGGVSGS